MKWRKRNLIRCIRLINVFSCVITVLLLTVMILSFTKISKRTISEWTKLNNTQKYFFSLFLQLFIFVHSFDLAIAQIIIYQIYTCQNPWPFLACRLASYTIFFGKRIRFPCQARFRSPRVWLLFCLGSRSSSLIRLRRWIFARLPPYSDKAYPQRWKV